MSLWFFNWVQITITFKLNFVYIEIVIKIKSFQENSEYEQSAQIK